MNDSFSDSEFEDPETCSLCVVEYEWEDLTYQDSSGMNLCPRCLRNETEG